MRSSPVGSWKRALQILTIACVAGANSIGCAGGPPYDGSVPPLPAGCPSDAPPLSAAQLDACLTALDFDTLEAAGDAQLLTVFNTRPGAPGGPCPPGVPDTVISCRHGPLAVIEPEINSFRYSSDDLAHGRIIAKLSVKGQTEGYDKLALAPGHDTYWWVLKDPRKPDSAAGRSVYITHMKGSTDRLPNKEYVLQYVKHVGRFKQGLARWVWDPKDEKTQGSCSQGCCR
jgi:hypothetical protein